MPSAAHWRGRQPVDVVAVLEIAELERAVHGAADRRAVAPALPRRELEIDGVLAEAFVGRRAGVVPRQILGEACGADGEPATGDARGPARVRPPMPRRRSTRARRARRAGARSRPAFATSSCAPAASSAAPVDASSVALGMRLSADSRASAARGGATRRDGRSRACTPRTAGGAARRRSSARRSA